MKHIYLLGASLLVLASCKPNLEPTKPTSGDANFTSYVAIGNSLTAGYADGTLYRSGQISSYPNMLAEMFAFAGGGEFKQPLLPGDAGWPSLKYVLGVSSTGSLGPTTYSGTMDTAGSGTNVYAAGPYNNVGIPGIRCIDYIMPGYATANPYAARLVNSPFQTALAMATSKPATFYTVWLGANDVLGYATGGGVGTVNTGITYPTATNNISSTTLFGFCYDSVVNNLARTGAKGALINIPDVTSIPYFTTVPYNPLNAADPNFGPQVATLNTQFAGLNQLFTMLGKNERKIIFNTNGSSPLLIKDKNLVNLKDSIIKYLTPPYGQLPLNQATVYGDLYGQCRQATAADLMVLPSSSVIAKPNATAIAAGVPQQLAINGVTYPLEDRFVLTGDFKDGTSNVSGEIALAKTATAAFNAIIAAKAQSKGWALVDMNKFFASLQAGMKFNGVTFGVSFVSGGLFSLDGVHGTQRGYAVVANEIIRAINLHYGSTIPVVDVNKYPGIKFP
jgi:lysophospholipase L1-like esterase